MILTPIRTAARVATDVVRLGLELADHVAGGLACSHAGYHVPSWARAVELGITDRPVCAVCDRPLAKDVDA